MKALVVDDDRILADLVSFTLRREGFTIVQAYDGTSAVKKWQSEQPDIVLLDVNLPKSAVKMDGFSVCRRIREMGDTPIILLTVREDEEDIVYGLKVGADDYILKPFSPRQLVARVQAVLRRSGKPLTPAVLEASNLRLDPERREARIADGDPIPLTGLENRLLQYLMLNIGHVLTTEDLISHVWGPDGGDRDMLRQLIRRLRIKIEFDPAQPTLIETVPGVGYGFRREPEE